MVSKIYAALACLALMFVVGWLGYQEFNTSNVTVDVQLKQGEDPFSTLMSIMPTNSSVVGVREINRDRNEYEVTVKTLQKKAHFLDRLRNNNRVESVYECPK